MYILFIINLVYLQLNISPTNPELETNIKINIEFIKLIELIELIE